MKSKHISKDIQREENETIFDAVHKYIILTKRFDVN